MSESPTPEQREAQILQLRKQLEELKNESRGVLEENRQGSTELERMRRFNEKLAVKLKHEENHTKQLEEKLLIEKEGGTDKLATLETLQDSYLEMIEQELNQIELDVMSMGDLSRLLVILSSQITRINQERDRRDSFIQRKINRLERKE